MNESLDRIVAWIEAETGLCFPEVHHETIRRAARARSGELDLEVEAYEMLLRIDVDEKARFLSIVMIGETYFFRDEKQFVILGSDILPELLREKRDVRLWSATCASGEEAISLVAVLEQALEDAGSTVDYTVEASDINRDALARLVAGRFPSNSFRSDGKGCHRLLDRCGAMEGQEWLASEKSLSHIRPRHLNLLSSELFPAESLDIVFLRNTLVYMPQPQKDRVIARVALTLRPGGCLFLASPEIPTVRHPLLEVVESRGSFFFRRLSHEAAAVKDSVRADRVRSDRVRSDRVRARPREQQAKRHVAEAVVPPSSLGQFELRRGLELASAWARDPRKRQAPIQGGPEAEAAALIEAIVATMHSNLFDRADALLLELEARAGETDISQYLRALSRKHQGFRAEARELLERALTYRPEFWPALFQAGLAYEADNPERSRSLMSDCLRALDLETEGDRYFALLEGFDASYYRRMAEKMLARMEST